MELSLKIALILLIEKFDSCTLVDICKILKKLYIIIFFSAILFNSLGVLN